MKNSLYDSYIKAFRYATDRIKDKGIICFITNGGWLDSASADGFRKCIEKEFNKIYILNLRGNHYTKGEKGKQEGGPIFGQGCRTTVCIVLLLKTGKNEGCSIKYCDIGDYLNREEKLAKIVESKSFVNLDLIDITSDNYGMWFNKREDSFDQFIPIYPEKKSDKKSKSFFTTYSSGACTAQDTLFYNSSTKILNKHFAEAIDYYNSERERYQNSDKKIPLEDFVNRDDSKLNFVREIFDKIKSNSKIIFTDSVVRKAIYRPFYFQILRNETRLMNCSYLMPKLFPNSNFSNLAISVLFKGKIEFSCLITDQFIDREFIHHCQNFPLYWYEKQEKKQNELDLFGSQQNGESKEEYIRKDGISDWIKKRADEQYNCKVSKEQIFYYVYGFLHFESYRKKFANNLKNELPKIPLVEDYATFEKISKAGRELAELHLHFEPNPKDKATDEEYKKYEISKVRQSDDKTKLFFYKKNGDIFEEETLDIPPEVDKWQINGSTCTWWIEKMYKVTTDPKTGRINDPNDYAREYGNPRYILELAKNVINIAVRTVAILDELNKLQVEI